MKRFFIESLGCAKNQVDSETIITLLSNAGFKYTAEATEAELILVNTCGFIQPAKEESISTVMDFRSRFPDKKIIMTGCLSQRYMSELEKEMTEIDGIWGTEYSDSFINYVAEKTGNSGASRTKSPRNHAPRLTFPGSAYVKIAEGCVNKCSFCAIPIIRGDLASRPSKEIVDEVKDLLEIGIHEINLVAQDSASYGMDSAAQQNIVSLVRSILEIKKDFWLRVLYLHPDKFPFALLDIALADSRFLPYFDIPFQHASTKILRAMGRKGDSSTYANLASRIRDTLPDATLRTTFLVGFPGETDEDFTTLTDFQKAIKPDWAGVFTYSREEDTPAFNMKNQVTKKTANDRKQKLEEAQTVITSAWLAAKLANATKTAAPMQVLVEERVEGSDLFLCRSRFQAPEVDGLTVVEVPAGADKAKTAPGERINVCITGVRGVDLTAVYSHE